MGIFERQFFNYLNTTALNASAKSLVLGGVNTSGAGGGGPAGGFVGQLPQNRVTFDMLESSTDNSIPASGASIYHNLNRIRYRIKALEDVSGTGYVTVEKDGGNALPNINILNFLGGVTISGVGLHQANITVSGGGGVGSLTIKEADNTPTVTSVGTIVVGNSDLTDLGGGSVRINTPSDRKVNNKVLSSDVMLNLASSDFSNQGTTTTVLHGNAAGNPSFGSVVENDINFSDNTTLNFSQSKHGLVPKASGLGLFLKDNGGWAALPTPPPSGHVIQASGTSMTHRTYLNFTGGAVSVSDDPGNNRTTVTISGGSGDYVPTSRTVNNKALTSNITLQLASADFANQGFTGPTFLKGNPAGNPEWDSIRESYITLYVTTTNDATVGKHGFLPAPGTSTGKFLKDDITWSTVTGTGHVIQDESTPLTDRGNLNFIGNIVQAIDDSGNNATKVVISGVPPTRTVNSKALSSDITLSLASADFANQGTTTTVLHGNASGNPSFGAVVENDITFANVTTLNVSNTKHGLVPKATDNTAHFLRADGTWAAPPTSSGGGGGGHTIQNEGSNLTQRTYMNFVGDGVDATDDVGNDTTLISIPSSMYARLTTGSNNLVIPSGYSYVVSGTFVIASGFMLEIGPDSYMEIT
jgi:hypothetical protein